MISQILQHQRSGLSLHEINVEIGESITCDLEKGYMSRNPDDYKEIYLLVGTDLNNLKRYELQFKETTTLKQMYPYNRYIYSTKIDSISTTSDTIVKQVVVDKNGKPLTKTVGILNPKQLSLIIVFLKSPGQLK